ncbi:MAG: SBBP repeat-containing protein [Acidobacteriota bacterium]|nr:SBBP repeat-containing protein [Acidobacteriota bacterium]
MNRFGSRHFARRILHATYLAGMACFLPPLTAQQPPAITNAASLSGVIGMAVDPTGNVYVVGGSGSTTPNAPYPTPPSQQPNDNSYLIKFDPQGKLVYATYLPGYPIGVAVDQNGNAYVGALRAIMVGQRADLQVALVDPTGTKATLANAQGGTCDGTVTCSYLPSFAIDGQGNAYLAANTTAGDVPTTPGAFQPKLLRCQPSGCLQAGFVIKINPRSGQVLYATYLGGSGGGDYIAGLAGDAAGNLYAVGFTSSTDFPVTTGAYRTTFGGTNSTSFVTKLNASGGAVYSTYFDAAHLNGVAADATGAAYVSGRGATGIALTPDAGTGGAEVAKLSSDGKSLVFSALLDQGAFGGAITVDASGSPVVVGTTVDTLLPELTPLQGQRGNTDPATICSPGSIAQHPCYDAFLVKLDPQGKQLLWASTLGGAGDNTGGGVATDAAGSVYAWINGFGGFPVPGVTPGYYSVIKVEAIGPPPLFGGASVVSSAGFNPGIGPGGLASIFGTNLSSANGIVSAPAFPLPTSLADTSVWFGAGPFAGRYPAAILAAANVNGQEQVNVQVPVLDPDVVADAHADFSTVIMRRGRAMGFAFDVKWYEGGWPGIFLTSGGQPVVTHADYTLVTPSNPARAGETIIIFASGLGPVKPPVSTGAAAPLSPLSMTLASHPVTIGGQDAAVTFEGLAPGFAGLYQVNVLVPTVAPGQMKLVLGGKFQNQASVNIAIQ